MYTETVERIVRKRSLTATRGHGAVDDLQWWLSRSVRERLEEVERLRKSYYGTIPRFERVARVVSRSSR